MKNFVKHSITQTKDYACSSDFAKDIAKNAAWASIGYLAGTFIKNIINNYINEKD